MNKTEVIDMSNYITNGEWELITSRIRRNEVRLLFIYLESGNVGVKLCLCHQIILVAIAQNLTHLWYFYVHISYTTDMLRRS